MWEDNNPLSYDRRDSGSTDDHERPSLDSSPYSHDTSYQDRPTSPDSVASSSDDNRLQNTEPTTTDDARDEDENQKKSGGYDSRIEQILWENRDLEILITDAGKNNEGGGGYIVYTIRTRDLEVRRRYSEFASLRSNLALLHPTLIIPPIPEKHSVADYVAAPTKAKLDQGIIEHRRRMLCVFLNRCARMKQVRKDIVFVRFLDPNVSWSEVLHSPPISALPKNPLRAPPIDPARPSPAHAFLLIPSSNAKLKSAPSPPASPAAPDTSAFAATRQLPSMAANFSETELDPYFITYESSTRMYETLLTTSVERVNRRILNRLASLSTDLAELGARYNAFSLSEPAPSLSPAIEKVGQAVDSTYLATEELAGGLASGFTEPLRESAQFAGVVRSVLKYRMMKRIQEEITKDELAKSKTRLEQLEKSEMEARRIEQYLHGSSERQRSRSPPSASARRSSEPAVSNTTARSGDSDTASIDSDFPPTHSQPMPPPISTTPMDYPESTPAASQQHRKTSSFSNTLTYPVTKIFGKLSHAVHGIVDVDPEATRRNNIGKTRESLVQLEAALSVSGKDVEAASKGVLADLKRFQGDKETDLKKLMITFAKCHIDWAKKNLESWEEAKAEVDKV